MDVLTVSFNDDTWSIENLVDLDETFTSQQRVRLSQVMQGWGSIMEREELREHGDTPDISRE